MNEGTAEVRKCKGCGQKIHGAYCVSEYGAYYHVDCWLEVISWYDSVLKDRMKRKRKK